MHFGIFGILFWIRNKLAGKMLKTLNFFVFKNIFSNYKISIHQEIFKEKNSSYANDKFRQGRFYGF